MSGNRRQDGYGQPPYTSRQQIYTVPGQPCSPPFYQGVWINPQDTTETVPRSSATGPNNNYTHSDRTPRALFGETDYNLGLQQAASSYPCWNSTSQYQGTGGMPTSPTFPLPQSPGSMQSPPYYSSAQPVLGMQMTPMSDVNNQLAQHPLVTVPRRNSRGTTPFSYRTSTVIGSNRQDIPKDEQELYESFQTRPRKFFRKGKVFLTLWSEPAGESSSRAASAYSAMSKGSGFSNGRFGQRVFSKIRRFVIVREGGDSCTAIPINTYDGQGVAKRWVRKAEHAIIYTGKRAPAPLDSEAPNRGEVGLLPRAIRIDSDNPGEKLDTLSRVDFGKVYTIEHNVKVRSLGQVSRDSVQALQYQFDSVWASSGRPHDGLATLATSPLPTVTERPAAVALLDWAQAFGILMANNLTEDQARSVLKPDPREQKNASTSVRTPPRENDVNHHNYEEAEGGVGP